MPKYMIQASCTAEGLAGAISQGFQARIEEVSGLIEAAGGTIEAIYFTYSEHDIVAIIDGSEEAAIALSLAVNAGGAVQLSTTPLISIEQMDTARAQMPDYRAPGA